VLEPIVLPYPLTFRESPNQSARSQGLVPFLVCWHRPVGSYHGSADWLCNPKAQASAHVLTEGNGTGVDEATQLVPWDRKAWACASFNSATYNIEVDDDAWNGADAHALEVAARIGAWLSWKTGIPLGWSKDPLNRPGHVFHRDLGAAGGGHSDPTADAAVRRNFMRLMRREMDRGGFRDRWGRGRLYRIKEGL
jgi:hypothetical protein